VNIFNLGGFYIDRCGWVAENTIWQGHTEGVFKLKWILLTEVVFIDLMWLDSREYNMARSYRGCVWIEINIVNLGVFFIDLNVAE
jgi:hypothetical protein